MTIPNNDLKFWRNQSKCKGEKIQQLNRSNSALRGVITKLKNENANYGIQALSGNWMGRGGKWTHFDPYFPFSKKQALSRLRQWQLVKSACRVRICRQTITGWEEVK
jgi:hypothetical protein